MLRATDRQRSYLAEALKLAETLGDQRRLGYALMFSTLRATLAGNYPEGLRLGLRALAIGEALDELGIHAGANCYLGITNLGLGRLPEAIRFCEASISLIPLDRVRERFGQARMVANLARGLLGFALGRQGRFSEALIHAQDALDLARAAGQAYSISSSCFELGYLRLAKGENAEAARDLEQGLEVWQTLQTPAVNISVVALGLAYCRMGRAREGLVLLDGAQQDTPVTFYYSEGTAFAEAYLLAGRMAEAAAQAQRALDHAREKGQRALEADALYMVAEVASRGEDLGGAEQRSRGAMSLADELGMRPLVAHCHLGLGKLYRRTGKREQAQEHLTTATTMYREMGMTYWLEKAEAESRS